MAWYDTLADVGTFGIYGAVTGRPDTAYDALAGPLGARGGSAPAPQYGQPRSGGGPDPTNFALGGNPDWVNQYDQYQRDLGNQTAGVGAGAQATQRSIGDLATQSALASGLRQAPTPDYFGSQQTIGQQRGAADALMALGQAPEGPSAAQAQLQAGTNQAMNSQLAIARGASGAGESAAALDQARFGAAGIQQNAANSAAALRAQERNDYLNRQAGAFGAAGQLYGGAAGIQTGQEQFKTQAQLQAQAQRDAAAQGYLGLASNANQIGYGQQIQANQAASGMAGAGAAGQQAALQGTMGLEQLYGDIYGAELQHQLGMREADQAGAKTVVSGASGMLEGLFSSDRRMKKNVKQFRKSSEVFAALGA